MPGPNWTTSEISELVALRAKGLAPREIAAALGRSQQAVNFKAHELQLPRPPRIRRSEPEERFWAKVEKTDGCWLWRGSLFASGYGSFWDGSRNVRAPRFAYELLVGPIQAGAELRHSCDTPACVNPDHLSPGSHAENMAEMARRGRRR
jgi:hypothetical protein